jgi:hypothetical protein
VSQFIVRLSQDTSLVVDRNRIAPVRRGKVGPHQQLGSGIEFISGANLQNGIVHLLSLDATYDVYEVRWDAEGTALMVERVGENVV